jgi:penicillin-binding protein 1A
VVRVRRASGEVIWRHDPGDREPVLDQRTQRYLNFLMTRVVQSGTATRARIPDRAIGGKTGTNNDYRDAWFVGYTPGIVTGVWVGNDDNSTTRRVTGGSLPTEIWHDYMVAAVATVPARPLDLPGPDEYAPGPALTAQAQSEEPSRSLVGAPIIGAPAAPAVDDGADRSLDFGPEG